MADKFTVADLTAVYVKIREVRKAKKQEFEAEDARLKRQQGVIEATLLARAKAQGVDGFKTPAGTSFQQEAQTFSIVDDDEFYDYIRRTGDYAFLERRIAASHVKEYAKTHDGRMPPGVKVYRETHMRVNAARAQRANRGDDDDEARDD